MARQILNTRQLIGRKVFMPRKKQIDEDDQKKVGRVRACVFHPTEKKFVGILVKRPDAAMMFKRKDLFVAYNGFDIAGKVLVIHDDPKAKDAAACKAMGIKWDDCVLWVGMPVVCEDGSDLGIVENIAFDWQTGDIMRLDVSAGATANALLGKRSVPVSMIRGFRRGIGKELLTDDGILSDPGAILVSDEARDIEQEGGIADKAGEASAVVADKARRAAKAAKPKAEKAANAAGKAIKKGAKIAGDQIEKTHGMFASFKEEFNKALNEDDD